MENKKVNISITDTHEFFAHELSVNFNPLQFILDFKCITPRVDPRTKDTPLLMIRHNVIMVDAFHAKKIHEMLGDVLKKYEEQHGKIEIPKAVKKAEKKNKKTSKEKKKNIHTTEKMIPSYFG